jgi:hypothetical protein
MVWRKTDADYEFFRVDELAVKDRVEDGGTEFSGGASKGEHVGVSNGLERMILEF